MVNKKLYTCEKCQIICFNLHLFKQKWLCLNCYLQKQIKYQKKLKKLDKIEQFLIRIKNSIK